MAKIVVTTHNKPATEAKEAFVSSINLELTQRQIDYLLCTTIMNLDPQDIIRTALDKWIDEQTGDDNGL